MLSLALFLLFSCNWFASLLSLFQSFFFCVDVVNHEIIVGGILIDLVEVIYSLLWVDISELGLEFKAVEMVPVS